MEIAFERVLSYIPAHVKNAELGDTSLIELSDAHGTVVEPWNYSCEPERSQQQSSASARQQGSNRDRPGEIAASQPELILLQPVLNLSNLPHIETLCCAVPTAYQIRAY